MYERASEPLLSRRAFAVRVLRHAGGAVLLLGGSLLLGLIGYTVLDGLAPVDAFLNASMILGGMGPVDPLKNDAAKIFAGLYALYSGVIFLVAVAAVFAPVLHRIFHTLHIHAGENGDSGDGDVA